MIETENPKVVVPWHNPKQRDAFLEAWHLSGNEPFLVLQRDEDKEGCARTKNKGIWRAIQSKASVIIVLDDDCFPDTNAPYFPSNPEQAMQNFIAEHVMALMPTHVPMFDVVTDPPSRGTPYFERDMLMPVAASMGFWVEVGDYDAVRQLVFGPRNPMKFSTRPIHGRYFPLCGMNVAFRPEWWPWCKQVEIPRFDDIWGGWLWQKKAYAMGYCFRLCGPTVRHSRQSNVWQNLRDESRHQERNEILWREIAMSPSLDREELLKLIPTP